MKNKEKYAKEILDIACSGNSIAMIRESGRIALDIDFPMIKWEDDKPWLIDDLKKLEVVEGYKS